MKRHYSILMCLLLGFFFCKEIVIIFTLNHDHFTFYVHFSSLQGEESLMVESKAGGLSNLADEKW